MAKGRILPGFMAIAILWAWPGGAAPLAAGEAEQPGPSAVAPGRLEPAKATEAERKKCEENLGKLAEFFKAYAQKVLDALGEDLIGGALPPNAKLARRGWPDPLEACRGIQAVFAKDPAVRRFVMPKYSYEGLCRLNQLINKGLEKGGMHAYLSEKLEKGRVTLVCVAGELLELRRDAPLRVRGKPLDAGPKVLGRILVRYPQNAFERAPSFTTDRKDVYHLVEVHRVYARKTWNRLEFLRKKGVDFGKDRIESEFALSLLKGLEGIVTKLAFAAWRDVTMECRRDRTDEEAEAAFLDACVASTVDDFDLYEELQLQETQGKVKKDPVQVKSRCSLAQIAHALRPMDCVMAKAVWLGCDATDPYRLAAEKFMPLLLDEASKLSGVSPPAGEAASRPLAERLTDLCGLSPEVLRRAAAAAFERLGGKR